MNGVVLRELDRRRRPREIASAVADVSQEGAAPDDQRGIQRATHAPPAYVPRSSLLHRGVRARGCRLEDIEDGPPGIERRRCRKPVEHAEGRRGAKDPRELIDGEARCDLACGMAPHAIGDDEQAEAGIGPPHVLVGCAHAPDVRRARKVDEVIAARNRPRHEISEYTTPILDRKGGDPRVLFRRVRALQNLLRLSLAVAQDSLSDIVVLER